MPQMTLDRTESAGLEGSGHASDGRTSRQTRCGVPVFAIVACLALASGAFGQEKRYELTTDDQWAPLAEADPDGEEAQLLEVRKALGLGEPKRALNLVTGFLERSPFSKWRPEALLLQGDARLALGDEFDALMVYEELIRRYPGSGVFVTALEREFEIAKQYANGLRRKLWGTFRILDASDEAEEILIRIQERLPGSTLAEKAGMTLADFYFDRRDLFMAAEAYDIFIENYPRSTEIDKARLRLIYSYLANFRGPEYDALGLLEAQARLKELQVTRPALAQKVGAEALLVRVYESDATKMLATAKWYLEVEDPISAEYTIRRMIEAYPDSIATLSALEMIPSILAQMPASAVAACPDYAALREAKLALSAKAAKTPIGVVAPPPIVPGSDGGTEPAPTVPISAEPTP
ncbi:MAG: outer membrane protein assembly factor BamD [Planctomycetota bacterium]